MSACDTADMFGEAISRQPLSPAGTPLLIPRLSVLNARAGDWQDRKRAWVAMGIRGEKGRNALVGGGGTGANSCYMVKRRDGTTATSGELHGTDDANCSSIFDPVLCELAYRWFSGEGSQIFDPFAGGSVRGIVAAHLGRKYWGCDLRAEQIEANRVQGAALCDGKPQPE